ncbi:hypothetical protein [Streptacidiphilus sp. EB129]|uniref:hypothetical protein n=1 Tax=Streptacidiphilus sp. EB129 TaxID=3156262 RepID=UPI0035141703
MRTARILTGVGLSVAALGLSAGAALADDGHGHGRTEVSPSSAVSGQWVEVSTTACGERVDSAKAWSGAAWGKGWFTLTKERRSDELTGQFRVRRDAEEGERGITIWCSDDKKVHAEVTVLGRRPHGAVRTGVGGSVLTGSTAETAGGVAMLAVAAGGGVFLVRRRGQGNQA